MADDGIDGRRPPQLAGEYDLSNVDEVAAAVEAAASATEDPAVVLDLTEVTFIDGTVLDVLATAAERLHAAGRRLRVEGTDAHQRKLFGLSGLADLLGEPEGPAPR